MKEQIILTGVLQKFNPINSNNGRIYPNPIFELEKIERKAIYDRRKTIIEKLLNNNG